MGSLRLFLKQKPIAVKITFNQEIECGESLLVFVDRDIDQLSPEIEDCIRPFDSLTSPFTWLHQVTEDGSVRLESPQVSESQIPLATINTISSDIKATLNTQNDKTFNLLTCIVCFQSLSDISAMNNHYRGHGDQGNLFCSLCNIKYVTLAQFKDHIRQHGNCESNAKPDDTSIRGTQCSICGKEFPSVKGLCAHMRIHKKTSRKASEQNDEQDVKVKPAKTKKASEKVTIRQILESNVPASEYSTTGDACKDCGEATSTRSTHVCGGNSATRVCDICKKKCSTEAIHKHILEVHSGHFSKISPGIMEPVYCSEEGVVAEDSFKCNYCADYSSRDLLSVLPHLLEAHEDRLKSLSCPYCSKSFQSEKRFASHMNSKDLSCSGRPTCKICLKTFSAQRAVRDHMSSMHSDVNSNPTHSCHICAETYATKSALRYHLKTKHQSSELSCRYCSKRFSLEVQRKRHEDRIHLKHRQHACDQCDRKFTTARELLNHLLCGHKFTPRVNERGQAILPDGTIGPIMKYYQCEHCSLTTYSRKLFIRHQVDHSGVWPFTCEICSKGFTARRQAERHVRLRHASQETHQCTQCPRIFVDEVSFKDHVLSHQLGNGEECTICAKWYESAEDFENHMASAHAVRQQYLCSVCPRGFSTPSALGLHVLVHKKLPSQWKLQCDVCLKKFKYKATLWAHKYKYCKKPKDAILKTCEYCGLRLKNSSIFEAHTRQHLGLKPYSCQYCSKGFTTIQSRASHITTFHTKNFSHYCPHCNKGTTSLKQLRRHLQAVHKVYSKTADGRAANDLGADLQADYGLSLSPSGQYDQEMQAGIMVATQEAFGSSLEATEYSMNTVKYNNHGSFEGNTSAETPIGNMGSDCRSPQVNNDVFLSCTRPHDIEAPGSIILAEEGASLLDLESIQVESIDNVVDTVHNIG